MAPAETDVPARKPSWKWRWLKRLATVVLLGLLTGGTGFWIWYAQCKAELDAEIARIRARGEPLEFADLAPRRHDYVRERKLRAALTNVPPLPLTFVETLWGNDLSNSQPRLIRPGDYPVLRKAIVANRQTVKQVVAMARQGDCRFTYDYGSRCPFDISLSHVSGLGVVWDLMKAEVIQSLGKGEPRRAFETIENMLHVTEVLRHEPFPVSHYLRRRDHDRALDLLQMAMSHAMMDADARDRLDATLKEIEERFRFGPVLLSERAILFTVMGTVGTQEFTEALQMLAINRRRGVVDGWIADWRDTTRSRWWGSFAYRPRLFQDKTFMLRMMGRMADLVDQPGPDAAGEWAALREEFDRQIADYPISTLVLLRPNKLWKHGMGLRQRLIAARIALRVDRYRQQHGKWPTTLEDVLDSRLTAIPAGLISGKRLEYETTDRGFRIYDRDPESSEPVGKFEILREGR